MAEPEPTDEPIPPPGGAIPLDPDVAKLMGLGEGQKEWLSHVQHATAGRPDLGSLGAYELLDRIGSGGQGSVYRARQPGTGRVVAIKRLWAEISDDPGAAARFQREVEALTRLSHPNVVAIHAVEVVEGRRLIVMEYVEGPRIDQWADRTWAAGIKPLHRVLEAFVQVCTGVSHGHQRGVIHCDIKPDNVLVDSNDTPRVLDFGIARIVAGDRAPASGWTMVGFAGTPAFAAPEQATASPSGVDTRSDIYALGVLLFRLVAGVEPFTGGPGLAGIAAIAHAQARGVPSVRAHRPAVSREIDWIIGRATALDPADRYQTADGLADDIRRFLTVQPVTARRPGPMYVASRFVRRHPIGVGLGVAALLAVLAASTIAGTQAYRLSIANHRLGEALASEGAATQQAKDQQARAEREAASQRKTSEMLYQAIAGATVLPGFTEPRADIPMRRAYAAILSRGAGEMATESEVALRLNYAITLRGERKYDQALAELTRVMEISRRIDAPDSSRRQQIHGETVQCLFGAGRAAEADSLCRAELASLEGHPLGLVQLQLRWMRALAIARAGGTKDEFVSAAGEMFETLTLVPAGLHRSYRQFEELGRAATSRGWFDLAEQWTRRAVEIAVREEAGPISKAILRTQAANALLSLARPEDAEPQAREASDALLESQGPGGANAHPALVAHAAVLHRLGRFSEAAARWELASRRPLTFSDAERAAAPIILRLAAAQFGADDPESARTTLRRALAPFSADPPDELARQVEAALGASAWQVDSALPDQIPSCPEAVRTLLTTPLP
jgi:hypothetical protein